MIFIDLPEYLTAFILAMGNIFKGFFSCVCPYSNLYSKASSILVSNNIANADTSDALHAPAMSVNVREITESSAGTPEGA